jgi:hypothetical protein
LWDSLTFAQRATIAAPIVVAAASDPPPKWTDMLKRLASYGFPQQEVETHLYAVLDHLDQVAPTSDLTDEIRQCFAAKQSVVPLNPTATTTAPTKTQCQATIMQPQNQSTTAKGVPEKATPPKKQAQSTSQNPTARSQQHKPEKASTDAKPTPGVPEAVSNAPKRKPKPKPKPILDEDDADFATPQAKEHQDEMDADAVEIMEDDEPMPVEDVSEDSGSKRGKTSQQKGKQANKFAPATLKDHTKLTSGTAVTKSVKEASSVSLAMKPESTKLATKAAVTKRGSMMAFFAKADKDYVNPELHEPPSPPPPLPPAQEHDKKPSSTGVSVASEPTPSRAEESEAITVQALHEAAMNLERQRDKVREQLEEAAGRGPTTELARDEAVEKFRLLSNTSLVEGMIGFNTQHNEDNKLTVFCSVAGRIPLELRDRKGRIKCGYCGTVYDERELFRLVLCSARHMDTELDRVPASYLPIFLNVIRERSFINQASLLTWENMLINRAADPLDEVFKAPVDDCTVKLQLRRPFSSSRNAMDPIPLDNMPSIYVHYMHETEEKADVEATEPVEPSVPQRRKRKKEVNTQDAEVGEPTLVTLIVDHENDIQWIDTTPAPVLPTTTKRRSGAPKRKSYPKPTALEGRPAEIV